MSEFLVIAMVGTEWEIVDIFEAADADEAIRQAALEEDDSQLFRAFDVASGTERSVAYRRRVVGLSEPTPEPEPSPAADSAPEPRR